MTEVNDFPYRYIVVSAVAATGPAGSLRLLGGVWRGLFYVIGSASYPTDIRAF
jgi:hypothetical protein